MTLADSHGPGRCRRQGGAGLRGGHRPGGRTFPQQQPLLAIRTGDDTLSRSRRNVHSAPGLAPTPPGSTVRQNDCDGQAPSEFPLEHHCNYM